LHDNPMLLSIASLNTFMVAMDAPHTTSKNTRSTGNRTPLKAD